MHPGKVAPARMRAFLSSRPRSQEPSHRARPTPDTATAPAPANRALHLAQNTEAPCAPQGHTEVFCIFPKTPLDPPAKAD